MYNMTIFVVIYKVAQSLNDFLNLFFGQGLSQN